MSEEKKKRNKIIGISIGILVVLLVVISSTYAYWQITKSQNGSNDIIAACLDIDMQSVDGTFGLNPAWPISDSEGMQLEGYTFTVTNNCEEDVNYVIGIDSLEVSGASYLDYNNIKISVDNTPAIIYGEEEDIEHIEENDPYQIRDSKKLYTATVKGKVGEELGVNTHNVKVWINSESSVEEQSKVFSGRMFITGGQKIDNDKPLAKLIATGDISKTEECDVINYTWTCTPLENHNNDVKYSLYSDGTLNIYGTGDIKTGEEIEDEFNPLMEQIIKDYATQNNITLSDDIIVSIDSSYPTVMYIMAAISEDPEIIKHLSEGQFDTFDQLLTVLPEANANMMLSIQEKLANFPKEIKVNISDGITSIGEAAFHFTPLKSISIASSVKEIKHKAFGMSYIENIELPEGLEIIGIGSFQQASIVNKLKLPSTLNTIKGDAFYNLTVKTFELPNNGILAENRDISVFATKSIDELIIPQNVIKIHENVFNGEDFSNTIVKLYGSERTIEGLDLTQFKEVIWNYEGE